MINLPEDVALAMGQFPIAVVILKVDIIIKTLKDSFKKLLSLQK